MPIPLVESVDEVILINNWTLPQHPHHQHVGHALNPAQPVELGHEYFAAKWKAQPTISFSNEGAISRRLKNPRVPEGHLTPPDVEPKCRDHGDQPDEHGSNSEKVVKGRSFFFLNLGWKLCFLLRGWNYFFFRGGIYFLFRGYSGGKWLFFFIRGVMIFYLGWTYFFGEKMIDLFSFLFLKLGGFFLI